MPRKIYLTALVIFACMGAVPKFEEIAVTKLWAMDENQVRDKLYETLMADLLSRKMTVTKGTGVSYASTFQASYERAITIAVAACAEWDSATLDKVSVSTWGAYWDSLQNQERAMQSCYGKMPESAKCTCQVIDSNKRNSLSVPPDVLKRLTNN